MPNPDLFAAAEIVTDHLSPIPLGAYIQILQELERQHGSSVLVQKWTVARGRQHAPTPVIAYKAVPAQHTQRAIPASRRLPPTPAFWQERHDPESERGEAVIRV